MSQHDLTIANQGFPAFRADLNNALQALGSTQSGTSAPSPTFANQLWYDTTNNQLKIRNEDNDAWITIATLDQTNDVLSAIALNTINEGTSAAGVTIDGVLLKDNSVTATADSLISGLTVGKGGGAVATATVLGNGAFGTNSTGGLATVVGYQAGSSLTSGNGLTVFGYRSGKALTNGDNTAVGRESLLSETSGTGNVGLGNYALFTQNGANYNVGVGNTALYSTTTGSNNTAQGHQALFSNTTASNLTAVGYQALYNNTGTENDAFGYIALKSNTTGVRNAAFGGGALQANTTGGSNVAMGRESLTVNTTGSNNVSIGWQSLFSNTTASKNTAVGYQAGYSNTTGTQNAFLGNAAGYANTTGDNNTALGHQSLDANTTGANNTAVGVNALGAQTTASSNTAIGVGAGGTITTGTKNTILGRYDGNQGGLDIRTASNYIVLSDGDGNPRQIIDNNGIVLVGTTNTNPVGADVAGVVLHPAGRTCFSRMGGEIVALNRGTDDGTLMSFCQAGNTEGSISVSGTTVSYNGGHLSRWSQWQNQTGKPEVYRGTVLESTNDMCEWNQPNEQSTKTIVSTTAKSKAVAGVFDMYDIDDEDNPYDFYVAQSGDFVIRIAQGVVVENGDLLESAGDGTARPQTDDICRSSTIAKVTSNYVSTTYADGSYCVPCILMIG